jgi:hypothetical protein
MDAVVTRKSLPLSARDLEELERLRDSAVHRDALRTLAGVDSSGLSEAALLKAVMDIGFNALLHQVEIEGYAAMATETNVAASKAVARRRRPSWADE